MKAIALTSVLCLVVCLAGTPARADFVNGGFEDGSFTGWTQDGGYWGGTIGVYNYTGDPGTSAIVGQGDDPLLAAMSVYMPMVYNGNYAARVNDAGGGNDFSTITQSSTWNEDHIYFAWSAVLEEPGHPHNAEPHFLIVLHDDTADTDLYNIVIAADTAPQTFQIAGDWKYSGWQVVDLDIAAAGAVGHTLTLTLLASDCSYGAHGGYVYLDGFGAAPPPQGDTPRAKKQAASDLLRESWPTGSLKVDDHLQAANKFIVRSLYRELWEDDSHLTRRGKTVFLNETMACGALRKVLEDPRVDQDSVARAEAAIALLVEADDMLAAIAMDEAEDVVSSKRDAKKLAGAEDQYAKAQRCVDQGNHGEAVRCFRAAWSNAFNLLSRHAQSVTDKR